MLAKVSPLHHISGAASDCNAVWQDGLHFREDPTCPQLGQSSDKSGFLRTYFYTVRESFATFLSFPYFIVCYALWHKLNRNCLFVATVSTNSAVFVATLPVVWLVLVFTNSLLLILLVGWF